MKKKVLKRSEKKSKKKWWDIFITAFAVVLIGSAFIWMSLSIYQQEALDDGMTDKYRASLPALHDTVDHREVCMVDDLYLGEEGMAVFVTNKTYYGCTQKAARDLATIDSIRYAKDPINKKKVDKASAIIMIHPDKDGKVIYFGSRDTHKKYLNALKTLNGKK